jgi:hypothetical protein
MSDSARRIPTATICLAPSRTPDSAHRITAQSPAASSYSRRPYRDGPDPQNWRSAAIGSDGMTRRVRRQAPVRFFQKRDGVIGSRTEASSSASSPHCNARRAASIACRPSGSTPASPSGFAYSASTHSQGKDFSWPSRPGSVRVMRAPSGFASPNSSMMNASSGAVAPAVPARPAAIATSPFSVGSSGQPTPLPSKMSIGGRPRLRASAQT